MLRGPQQLIITNSMIQEVFILHTSIKLYINYYGFLVLIFATAAHESLIGSKLDVWCLGVLLYTLVSAQFPFDVQQRKKILKAGG